MSSRTILSRPRTRLYESNYNIGESYYKSALDSIDEKYNRKINPSPFRDVLDRNARSVENDTVLSPRFEARSARPTPSLADDLDLDAEESSLLNRISTARKARASLDDLGFDSTLSSLRSSRMADRSEKILDTVGITKVAQRVLDEEFVVKPRVRLARTKQDELTTWKPFQIEKEEESAASLRAKASRNRLQNIEDEMNSIAEKQTSRAQRVAKIKSFIVDNCEESRDNLQEASMISSKEKRTVHF